MPSDSTAADPPDWHAWVSPSGPRFFRIAKDPGSYRTSDPSRSRSCAADRRFHACHRRRSAPFANHRPRSAGVLPVLRAGRARGLFRELAGILGRGAGGPGRDIALIAGTVSYLHLAGVAGRLPHRWPVRMQVPRQRHRRRRSAGWRQSALRGYECGIARVSIGVVNAR